MKNCAQSRLYFASIRKDYEKPETLASLNRTMTEKVNEEKYNAVGEMRGRRDFMTMEVEAEAALRLEISK
jgi:hypothetical protein